MNLIAFFFTFLLIIICYFKMKPKKTKQKTEFYVQMPINLIEFENNNQIHDEQLLEIWLYKLYKAGVDGVVINIIWGIVEKEAGKYDFSCYKQFIEICKKYQLKVTVCLAFHRCDGIQIPEHIYKNGFFCKDVNETFDDQYISPFFDMCVLDDSRTPLQCYSQLMIAFRDEFGDDIAAGVIDMIQIGLGPDGELKYPSCRNDWKMPGIGSCQCFDEISLDYLKKAGIDVPDYLKIKNENTYNQKPEDSEFWMNIGKDEKSKKFFDWYNDILCAHCDQILVESRRIFGENVNISAKIPLIYWYSSHPSHAAEALAGSFTFLDDSAYERFARSFAKFGVTLTISGLELDNDNAIYSEPQKMIEKAWNEAEDNEIGFVGENLNENYSANSLINVFSWSIKGLKRFTFNRLSDEMMQTKNWVMFNELIRKLKSEKY